MDFDFEPEEQAPAGHKPQRPRKIRRSDDAPPAGPVPVDGADFFRPSHQEPPPPPVPPRHEEPGRPQHPIQRGLFMLILLVQAALSAAAVIQLYRTRMLPNYYLAILGALLALVWLLFFKCQRYKVRGALTRLLSLALSAAMAVGCVWAQQGLDALDKVTMGDEETDYEAQAITTQPFVVYLSGVDNRGELTEDARSDVNILAVVNPVTKRVALVNTPRDYYVDLAGTDSKDKLTHAGLYGVETSMQTLGDLYGIQVDEYVRINFAGFIDIVDALGGIDVYSDTAFTSVGSPGYYDPTDFVEGWEPPGRRGRPGLCPGTARLCHRRYPAGHQSDEGDRRHAGEDQEPRPADQLQPAAGGGVRQLCHQPVLGTDRGAGADAAVGLRRLGHRELQCHRHQFFQHPLLFGPGPETVCHDARRGVGGRGPGGDPVGAQRGAGPRPGGRRCLQCRERVLPAGRLTSENHADTQGST